MTEVWIVYSEYSSNEPPWVLSVFSTEALADAFLASQKPQVDRFYKERQSVDSLSPDSPQIWTMLRHQDSGMVTQTFHQVDLRDERCPDLFVYQGAVCARGRTYEEAKELYEKGVVQAS